MAEGDIPNRFLTSSQTLASYDFIDIAEGTGVVQYYGAENSASYFLTANANIFSNLVLTTTQSSATTDTIQHDRDFDITFLLPKNLKGNVYVSVPSHILNNSGSSQTIQAYVKVYVRKWDGTTETAIANATSDTLNTGNIANGANVQGAFGVSVAVNTLQHFKAGETLRITIEYHGWSSVGSAKYTIGHDPQNRAEDMYLPSTSSGVAFSVSTKMQFSVPFKMEL